MKRIVFALIATVLLAAPAFAQFETGTVVGTLKDSTGAVVPGAKVTLTNTATGVTNEKTSDANGSYEFFTVRPGAYVITAEKAGFSIALVDNIQVTVGARQRVDLSMAVGQLTEKVEVSASAVLLQTDSSDRSQVITGEQTRALPLNGREYSALALLSPGRAPVGAEHRRLHAARRLVQRQRPALDLQQLPDRRRRQQRLRHQQPGLLEPGDAAGARRGRRVQGRHQQHERRVRALGRRDHQRRVCQRHQHLSRRRCGSSCAAPSSTRPASSVRRPASSPASIATSSAA